MPDPVTTYGPYDRGCEVSTPRGVFAVPERAVLIVDAKALVNPIRYVEVPVDFPGERLLSPPGQAMIPLTDPTNTFGSIDDAAAWATNTSVVDRPSRNARKDTWVGFRINQGYDASDLEGLTRPDLIALPDDPSEDSEEE